MFISIEKMDRPQQELANIAVKDKAANYKAFEWSGKEKYCVKNSGQE